MLKIYINKVLSLLTIILHDDDMKVIEDCFYKGLAPHESANVIKNRK